MRFGHGANLPDGDLRSEFLKNGVQSGLSGGTQNSGSAVVPDQLGNRPDTGSQIGEGSIWASSKIRTLWARLWSFRHLEGWQA